MAKNKYGIVIGRMNSDPLSTLNEM
ncbi:MAG: hypothetical protein JWL80_49, partial [Parcubacteria group bacterium]|nr:hypothetical protein [Parcubacteria group bacterium]